MWYSNNIELKELSLSKKCDKLKLDLSLRKKFSLTNLISSHQQSLYFPFDGWLLFKAKLLGGG